MHNILYLLILVFGFNTHALPTTSTLKQIQQTLMTGFSNGAVQQMPLKLKTSNLLYAPSQGVHIYVDYELIEQSLQSSSNAYNVKPSDELAELKSQLRALSHQLFQLEKLKNSDQYNANQEQRDLINQKLTQVNNDKTSLNKRYKTTLLTLMKNAIQEKLSTELEVTLAEFLCDDSAFDVRLITDETFALTLQLSPDKPNTPALRQVWVFQSQFVSQCQLKSITTADLLATALKVSL